MSSKGKKLFQWLLISLLSFQFIGAILAKLSGLMCAQFMAIGFTYEFMLFVGFIEAISVVGLFMPSLRMKASLIQVCVMCGAIYANLQLDQAIMVLLNITNMGLSFIVIWVELDKKVMSDDMLLKEHF